MNDNRLIIPVFIFFMLVSAVSATTTDGDDPWIRFDRIGDQYAGDLFAISGTTNLPVDDILIVEVESSSLLQAGGSQIGEYSGSSETVRVVEGDTCNKWSIDVDGSSLKPDEYIVNVKSVETGSTSMMVFSLLDDGGTTATAMKTADETATAATVLKTEATTIPSTPTETAKAPGFGALAALFGIGTAATLLPGKE